MPQNRATTRWIAPQLSAIDVKSVSRHRKQRKYRGHRYRNGTSKVDLSRAFCSRGGFHRHVAALMNSVIGVFRRSQCVGVKSVSRHQVLIGKFVFCSEWEGMGAVSDSRTCCRISIAFAICTFDALEQNIEAIGFTKEHYRVTCHIALRWSAEIRRIRILLTLHSSGVWKFGHIVFY